MSKESQFYVSSQEKKETVQKPAVIVMRVDLDSTLTHAKYPHGILHHIGESPVHLFTQPIDGAVAGLQQISEQNDVVFGGIATARIKYLQGYTKLGVERHFGPMEIAYASRNFTKKITNLLDFAENQSKQYQVSRTVLIDDESDAIYQAIKKLAQIDYNRERMRAYGLTYVAFNPRTKNAFEMLPVDFMQLNNWSSDSVSELLEKLRK